MPCPVESRFVIGVVVSVALPTADEFAQSLICLFVMALFAWCSDGMKAMEKFNFSHPLVEWCILPWPI